MERSCIRNGFTYIGDEEFSQQIGKDLIDCVRDSTVENLDDENVEKILQSYKETFRFNLIEMFDGMRRVLELCNDLGDSIAIASSRHSSSLNKLITQLEIKPH
jgi:phosphoglycolate phosphatase-like HAD superfamily hydrolase